MISSRRPRPLAAEAFEGYVVRKDLARRFQGLYPVPTYVGEFLLGRYCATTDEAEIAGGPRDRRAPMRERTVRAGEEELFKSNAREHGHDPIIDLITGAPRRGHRLVPRRAPEPSAE